MSDRKESSSFLNRWSSRKRQSAGRGQNADAAPELMVESELPESAQPATLHSEGLSPGEFSSSHLVPADNPVNYSVTSETGLAPRNNATAPVESATVLLTDADMPDIETLTSSSDISGFLGKGVSAALRKAALRHVFRQPQYNVRDGLDDYDDDYTTFEPLGDTVTSDMKFHAAREERARLSSERLSEESIQTELDTPVRAENAQDNPSTVTGEQTETTADEQSATREDGALHDRQECDEQSATQEDGALHDGQECHENAGTATPGEAEQHATLSPAALPDQHTNTDKPLNKTSQATASQPDEIPNE